MDSCVDAGQTIKLRITKPNWEVAVLRFTPPDDDAILYETGFGDDILGREKVGQSLSQIFDKIEDPLVIAVDGKWGTGKSYFLKRWVGAHRNQNQGRALTVYFDAFAHDYLTDPLVALMGSVAGRVPQPDQLKLKQAKRIAMKLVKPAVRLGMAAATSGATVFLGDFWDGLIDGAKGEADKALESFWSREASRHAAMEQFRSAIQALTVSSETGQTVPIVVVIDELDRCRPDFALELLEVVKHFFSVPHVHFVLGVNLSALENSVKVRYGSEIDAAGYLHKFLSFSVSLPDHIGDHARTPSIIKYVEHLGTKMGTPRKVLEELVEQVGFISVNNDISMREIAKIMSTASLLPKEITADKVLDGWRSITMTLLIARIIRPILFKRLVQSTVSEEELLEFLGAKSELIVETLPSGDRNPRYRHRLMYLAYCWKFILRDGQSDGSDVWRHFPRLFDAYGSPHAINGIPARIYDKYLSFFTLDAAD